MHKLTIAAFVVLLAAGLGAQASPAQQPAAQAPTAQTAPQAPSKPAAPPSPQTPPPTPTQTAKPPTPPAPAAQAASRATATLFVTNPSGAAIPDVKITLSGASDREVVTTREAATRIPSLRSGTYRVRFEAPDYITFEKELVLRPGQSWEFEITLNPAPVKKVEAPAPPPPSAVKKPVAPPPEPAGEATVLSLSDWLDAHLIGRNEPQRDSALSQTRGAAASIFQVREDVTDRVHADADEMFYVIAGEATVHIGDREHDVAAGWFATIPRGTTYSIQRRGRNPLILLSITAPAKGAPSGSR